MGSVSSATEKNNGVVGFLEHLVPVLMSIYLFLNPFPHTTSIKEICSYLALAIVLGLWAAKKKRIRVDTPLMRALFAFLVWGVITIPFAVDKSNTVHDVYSHLIRYMLFYIILINYFNTEKRLNWLVWLIIISSLVFICWSLYYYYFMLDNSFTRRLSTGRMGALAQASIHIIGFVALFASMLSLKQIFCTRDIRARIFLIVCIFFAVTAIFLTQSRGIIIALFFSSIMLLFVKKKILLPVVVVLLVLLVWYTPVKKRFALQKIMKDPRITIYQTMSNIVRDYPVTGIGFGMESYSKLDPAKYVEKLKHPVKKKRRGRKRWAFIGDPHNWAVGLLVRTGVVGLSLYLLVIFSFFKMAVQVVKARGTARHREWGGFSIVCFTGFLVFGLFEPIFTHIIEGLMFSLFAMLTIAWRLDDEKPAVGINDSDKTGSAVMAD
ncbi:MAG: O-antigen ligase family protein [Thermodesulfobacteriota bacterium]|nr:O-antigen ligase family protein [Thermodesulfobacteriota bacterium]